MTVAMENVLDRGRRGKAYQEQKLNAGQNRLSVRI